MIYESFILGLWYYHYTVTSMIKTLLRDSNNRNKAIAKTKVLPPTLSLSLSQTSFSCETKVIFIE